jgi:PAS domain S-box-containing protein
MFSSIKTKLVLLVLATATPLLILIFYNNAHMLQISSQYAEMQLEEQAYLASIEFANDIRNASHLLINVLNQPDIVTSRSKCDVVSDLLMFREPNINNLLVFKSDGTPTCMGSNTEIPTDIHNKVWFQAALGGKTSQISLFESGWSENQVVTVVAEPHIVGNGSIDGVVVLLLNQNWVQRSKSLVAGSSDAVFSLISSDGTILFREPNIAGDIGARLEDDYLSALSASQKRGSISATGVDGVNVIYGFARLDESIGGYYLVVGIPRTKVLSTINQLNLENLIITILVIIIAAIFARVFAETQLLRTLNLLVNASQKMAGGDLTSRTGLTEDEGELGILGKTFDDTANELQRKEEERRQALEQAEKERKYFETLVHSNPVAIAFWDIDQQIKLVNPAFTELFGYEFEDLRGKNLDQILNTEETIAEGSMLTDEVRKGNSVRAISKRRKKDGTLVDVEIIGVPIEIEGKQIGDIGLYHDISDLMKAKLAAEASVKAKAEFLANMSHEIRTPLNAVIGMTNILMDTSLDIYQKEFVETIRGSGDDLLTIINDILDFSKIEAGKLDLESTIFDVSDCVESAMQLLSQKASEKGLEMLYLFDPNTPVSIAGDSTRLRQILVNLIGNAIKFTEKGEIQTTVDAKLLSESEYEFHFAVSDTGIGIPEESRDRIFKSFSQADSSTTRKFGGSGLGLSISKRLVEKMGGRMWFDSEYGKGSTFHFTIIVNSSGVSMKKGIPDGLTITKGKTVLIVDDNERNRMILTKQLESWLINPIPASSGFQALEILRRIPKIDAAILDMQMPEMDGSMLAQSIKKLPGKKKMPLILLSSFGRKELPETSQHFSAQLSKPVRPSILLETLLSVFSHQPVQVHENTHQNSVFDKHLAEKFPLRILLAEDNVINQKVASRMLERMGYRIDLAADGLEVLQALERQTYDLVFMDVQMPEMDGIEATNQIRQRFPKERIPRIVAMTAHALEGDRDRFLAEGMDDYVSKPIQINDLVRSIENVVPLKLVDSSTATHSNKVKSIQWDTLDQYYRVMGDDAVSFITELIATFIPNAHILIHDLNHSARDNNLKTFHRSAHTLKSSSASLGAIKLSDIAKSLEFDCKDEIPEDYASRLDLIEAEMILVEQEFNQFLAGENREN